LMKMTKELKKYLMLQLSATWIRSFTCFIFLTFLFSIIHLCWADSLAVIEIKYRHAGEVVPMIRPLLSANGTVTVDQRTNSLIISDDEGSIHKIRTFLDDYDKPIQQVTVHVRFNEVRSKKEGSVSTDARVSGDKWSISTNGKTDDGVDVMVRGSKKNRRGDSEFFVRVASGSPAYILAGKEIPYTEKWLYLCRKYVKETTSIVFHRFDTGFEVFPVVMGDRVSLDIIPRISYEVAEREPGIIRFTSASTSLLVPMNQWIAIGGTSGTDNEVMTAILEASASKQNSKLIISIKVISDE